MRCYFLSVPDVPSRPDIVQQRWHLDFVKLHESDALERAKIDVLKDYIRYFQGALCRTTMSHKGNFFSEPSCCMVIECVFSSNHVGCT